VGRRRRWSDATNTNMKYLSRMMRVWKDYCDVPMSGILIDTLAYQFLENYEHRDKSFSITTSWRAIAWFFS
jgi:hypothetical protein